MVVSKVQALPPRSRRWPRPRATRVSNVNQASVTPSASLASPSSAKFEGCVSASRAASIARIAPAPSCVRMFQVKATRSRQKPSASNSATVASTSLRASAAPKSASQVAAARVGAAVDAVIECLRV